MKPKPILSVRFIPTEKETFVRVFADQMCYICTQHPATPAHSRKQSRRAATAGNPITTVRPAWRRGVRQTCVRSQIDCFNVADACPHAQGAAGMSHKRSENNLFGAVSGTTTPHVEINTLSGRNNRRVRWRR